MPSRACDDGAPVSLSWVRRGGRDRLRILGLSLDGSAPPPDLAVLPADLAEFALETPSLQPLDGRVTVDGEALDFTPRLPFVDGLAYALVLRGGPTTGGKARVWTIHRTARAQAPSASVLDIYPTAPAVPLNLLKLYVQFSAAMSDGRAADAVEVRREDTGELLENVFHRGRAELWDPGRRRLTLLLDPGRIKRGLGPQEALGYPLVEGTCITVDVTDRFCDAQGAPLVAAAQRRYRVGPPVREHVAPARWRQRWPSAGSSDPLTVRFDRPLDHALLHHAVRVMGPDGAPVPGTVVIGAEERSWRFHPDQPWAEAAYVLAVDPV
ncbi:MAG TPA: hypothetical protein VHX64_09415, partial [Caulobacteraceae bacterium]|nr:hypothetical protein [Caulobacteraceae bacterium]